MSDPTEAAKEAYLRTALEERFGSSVIAIQRLDRGVLGVRFQDGRHWVVRVFGERRPIDQVKGDAAILRLMEDRDFPAERCAGEAPVFALHAYSLLVTEFIDGSQPDPTKPALRAFGELLGRLHTLPIDVGGVARPAGALHHYVLGGGTPQEELSAAKSWLDALEGSIPAASHSLCDSLRQQLAGADTCSDLPEALIHPDPVLKNLLAAEPSGELTLIDWTGAGRGPRLFALAISLWSAALGQGNWSPACIDALARGYRAHIRLEPDELRRLAGVMRTRPLVFACWRFRHAVNAGRAPDGSEWWWPSERLADAIAKRACDTLRT